METNRLLPAIGCVVFCLFFEHCASSSEPSGWLTKPEKVPVDPYGAWIEVTTTTGSVQGEFIAAMEDTVFVADTSLKAIDRAGIKSARVVLYNSNDVAGGLLGGPIMTISNGVFLVFTFPMWIIGGTIATVSRSYDPVYDYPSRSFEELQKYARFPRGLPPGIDRAALRMKKVEKR